MATKDHVRSFVLACALLVVGAPSALAQGPFGIDVDAAVERIAAAEFADSQCNGHVRAEIVGHSSELPPGALGGAFGSGQPNDPVYGCRMVILRPELVNVYLYCAIYVHEYGHLAGAEHSAPDTDIMSPVLISTYAPCLRLQREVVARTEPSIVDPSITKGEARAYVRARFPRSRITGMSWTAKVGAGVTEWRVSISRRSRRRSVQLRRSSDGILTGRVTRRRSIR